MRGEIVIFIKLNLREGGMYKKFDAAVLTVIFDQSRAQESNAMVGAVRQEYNSRERCIGSLAVRYLGKDAPPHATDIGFLIGDEFHSGHNPSAIVTLLRELDAASLAEA